MPEGTLLVTQFCLSTKFRDVQTNNITINFPKHHFNNQFIFVSLMAESLPSIVLFILSSKLHVQPNAVS